MNEKQLADLKTAIMDTVKENVPNIIAEAVEAKTSEITAKMDDMTSQFKQVIENSKFSDATQEAKKAEQVALTVKILKGASFTDEEKAAKGLYDSKIMGSSDTNGQYLVPDEFHKTVVMELDKVSIARKYCRIIPMSSNAKDVPTLTGSITAYVVGGGSAITASDPTFGNAQLMARKFAVLVHAWNELIDDNMSDMEIFDLIVELTSEAFAILEDTQVLTGAGTGNNFEGILTNASTNVVTMATGRDTFAELIYDDLIDMVSAVAMKYKRGKKPIWVMSQYVFGIIWKLKDDQNRPLLSSSPVNPLQYTLLGFDVEVTDVMPSSTAVSTKFLIFGDLRYYAFGDRKAMTAEEGYHDDQFGKDIKSLRIIERVAGKILIPTAFSVLKTAAS